MVEDEKEVAVVVGVEGKGEGIVIKVFFSVMLQYQWQ